MAERFIPVEDADEQRMLFGSLDRNVRAIRERWGVSVSARRGTMRVFGDDEAAVREVVRRVHGALVRLRERGDPPTDSEVFALLMDDPPAPEGDGLAEAAAAPERGRRHGPRQGPGMPDVRPMSAMQARYVEEIRARDVVLAVGPAGTGKTYLAVAEAVASLRSGRHKKLILTRPAVEAGEKLGFLPGDFHAKINPYLRPLYDALEEMLRFGELQRSIATDVIEILPLAYMRGRTLKHAFIILDEAQNTTPAQMKMFLTRMGEGSKIVVTGDLTQVDLPDAQTSGLLEAVGVLRGVEGLAVVEFSAADTVRHPMVQRIVDAYGRAAAADEAQAARAAAPRPGPP
jgi:phosphate starvation-inducible PhoH-like protein